MLYPTELRARERDCNGARGQGPCDLERRGVPWAAPYGDGHTTIRDGVPNMAQTATATQIGLERAAARSGFFFWISILLLAFLMIGFAPSLYLRAFFDVAPIPVYLHVHGAIATSWFVWLVLQTSMVRTGRTATHRRLGVVGAVIAVAVVFAGPVATIGAVGRIREAGFDWDTDMSALPSSASRACR
jgi:hypothetical protein